MLRLLAIFVVIFYVDYLLVDAFIWDDALFEFYPGVHYFATAVRAGRFPLWISGVHNGVPFYSDIQLGIFYPPTWLCVIFAGSGRLPVVVYQWYLVLHVLLGGMFMFRFLKDYCLRPVACLTGSVVFCFAGFMSLNIIHPNRVQVYAWLPLQLLLVKRLLATHHAKYFCYLVVGTLLSFLAGYPQVSLYCSFLVIGFWLFSWWLQQRETLGRERKDRFLRATKEILKIGALFLCILLLSAIVVLPAAENWYYSSRPDMGWQEIAHLSLPYRGLIGLMVPNFFGKASYVDWTGFFNGSVPDPDSVVRFWGFAKEPFQDVGWPVWQYQYCEVGAYAGQLSLLAIVVLLFNWKRLENRTVVGFFAVICGSAIWFMLGRHAGLFTTLFHILPGISLFRGPTKMAAVLDCAAAVLVAFLVDALASGQKLKFRGTAWVFGIGYVSLAVGTLAFGRLVFPELADDRVRSYSLMQMCIGTGFWLASFGAAYGITRLPDGRRSALLAGLPLLVATDLFVAYGSFHRGTTNPAEYYGDRGNLLPQLQRLREDMGPFRFGQLLGGDLYQEVVYPRNFAYMHDGIEYPEGYISFSLREWAALQAVTNQRVKMALQNIRVTADESRQSHLVELALYTNSLPRVKFYRNVKSYESNERILADLAAGRINYNNEIAILASSGVSLPAMSYAPADANDEVQTIWHSPECYTIRYSVSSPGIIFVSETYYPGWKTSDPRFQIVKAFGAFKGIVVPEAGIGELTVRFAPDMFKIGWLISGLSGVAFLGALVVVTRKRHPTATFHED